MYKLSGIITRILYNNNFNLEYDNLVRYFDSDQFYCKYKKKSYKQSIPSILSYSIFRVFKSYNRHDHNEELWTMNRRVKWTTGYRGNDAEKYKAFNCFRFNDDIIGNNAPCIPVLADYISPESNADVCIHKYSDFATEYYNRFEYYPPYRKITAKDGFKDELEHGDSDGY